MVGPGRPGRCESHRPPRTVRLSSHKGGSRRELFTSPAGLRRKSRLIQVDFAKTASGRAVVDMGISDDRGRRRKKRSPTEPARVSSMRPAGVQSPSQRARPHGQRVLSRRAIPLPGRGLWLAWPAPSIHGRLVVRDRCGAFAHRMDRCGCTAGCAVWLGDRDLWVVRRRRDARAGGPGAISRQNARRAGASTRGSAGSR